MQHTSSERVAACQKVSVKGSTTAASDTGMQRPTARQQAPSPRLRCLASDASPQMPRLRCLASDAGAVPVVALGQPRAPAVLLPPRLLRAVQLAGVAAAAAGVRRAAAAQAGAV